MCGPDMVSKDESSTFGPVVDVGWLTEHLLDPRLVVADVRWYLDDRSGRVAYDTGHIPGSVFVDLDTDLSSTPTFDGGRHPLPHPVEFARSMSKLGIGDGQRVVAYDDVGGAIAARMWWMLDAVGVESAVLDGGIGAWSGELSTETADPVRAWLTRTPWPTERMASIDEVDVLRLGETVIIDARDADRFARGSAIDARPGHVPGARSAPFAENLVEGVLKPRTELRRLYEGIGVGARPVVVYCGSGVTACHDLLALRRAGLGNGRLFVGSWSAWGADTDRPAEQGRDNGPGSVADDSGGL